MYSDLPSPRCLLILKAWPPEAPSAICSCVLLRRLSFLGREFLRGRKPCLRMPPRRAWCQGALIRMGAAGCSGDRRCVLELGEHSREAALRAPTAGTNAVKPVTSSWLGMEGGEQLAAHLERVKARITGQEEGGHGTWSFPRKLAAILGMLLRPSQAFGSI